MSLSRLLLPCLGLTLATSAAAQQKQLRFSIDWHGPTLAKLDPLNNTPITEGDVLQPSGGFAAYGPLPPPDILLRGVDLGIVNWNICVGHAPGTPCGVELDALSFGKDAELVAAAGSTPRVWFTVDEYAAGQFVAAGPNVASESAADDSSGDIYVDVGLPALPVGPAFAGGNAAVFDGNGELGASGNVYPGLGLVEPNPATMNLPNPGDHVDAIDISEEPLAVATKAYISLDAGFPDPLAGANNSNSAGGNAVTGADVLEVDLTAAAAAPYAPAAVLGLDKNGPGTDDVDALMLLENGVPGFQPSLQPFDWANGSTDMLVFSVRRGSAVIGQPDSIFGAAIEEGDLLVPPVQGGNGFPGILIAAEALGLRTKRQFPNMPHGDDLTGGDLETGPFRDCNQNGVEDSVDIATGTSTDHNGNGVPDECEPAGSSSCECPSGPCGNDNPDGGCLNSTGLGAFLKGTGSSSVVTDDLVLTASGVTPNQFGVVFMGDVMTATPTADGIRCADAGNLGLHRFPVQFSGAAGVMIEGPGLVDQACNLFPAPGCIAVGQTWHFQGWYRDPTGPCGQTSNFTSAWSVTFTL